MKVGGSIAGLTLAAYCREKYDVTILEQNSYNYTKQLTTGFSVGGYAKALYGSDYGPNANILERAIENNQVIMIRAGSNHEIIKIPKEDRVWMTRYSTYHRGLSQMVESSAPARSVAKVIWNALVTGAELNDGFWEVEYQLYGANKRVTADILVAADGVHSSVRRMVLGNDRQQTPRSFGKAWRGRLPATFSLQKDMNIEPKGALVWVDMVTHHVLL